MKRYIIFCLVAVLPLCMQAQGQGQVVISAGAGYSPGFNGQVTFISQTYPTAINTDIEDGDYGFTCSSILPNLGCTVDYGITRGFSIGLAASYQSETVSYELPPTYTDQVSRTNAAVRCLFHLSRNKRVDDYFGIRFGLCYWHDTPSPQNTLGNPNYPPITFLLNTNSSVETLQVLYGIRLYVSDNTALHMEVGIGQPYLVEAGLSFRIGTDKYNPISPTKQGSGYGGHPAK